MSNSIKYLFAYLTFLGLTQSAYAASINQNVAQTVGANFLISKGVAGVNGAANLTLVYTATTVANGNTINDYYVFNVAGAKGFVMVSGDDNIIPILAFSNNSNFSTTNMCPSTKDWIDGYKNQITAAINNNVPAKSGTADLWSLLENGADNAHHKISSTTSVAPLVQTTWDQDGGSSSYPYNYYCPNTGSSGGLSVTGCVSTAMAQLMKFWNWPTVGSGYHSYYDATGSLATPSVNYGNTAYNWSGMPLNSSNEAVATLMLSTGVSVNMSYTADESGSYVDLYQSPFANSAEYALQTYFHYKPSLRGVLRFGIQSGSLGSYYEGPDDEYYHGSVNMDSVAEASWITMLQNELNIGHPMLYEGQGSVGGHCWILDGWETTDDMFHFNWGWSGASDGYYTVDNLAPPALGTGGGAGNFNYDQGVIMGVEPDSFPSNPGNIELLAHLNNATNMPMDYGTPFTIVTKIGNTGTSAFNGSFCVELFDTSTNMITIIDSMTGVTIAAGDSTAVLTFTCKPWAITPEIFNGMRIAYEPAGTTTWTPVASNGTFINYSAISVLNDTDISLYDVLHVSSPTIYEGDAFTVTTTIGNQGMNNFNGTLEAVLVNTATGALFTIQQHSGASLASYATNSYTFTNASITLPAGLYALEIMHQYGGSGSFYTTSSDFFLNPILIQMSCAPNPGLISGPTAVCTGGTITLSDTAAGGGGTWSLSNGTLATVSGGVVTTTATGVDTLKYSLVNSCGTSTSTAVINIEVFPTAATISGPDSVCIDSTITLSDATTGGTWSTMGSGVVSISTGGVVSPINAGADLVFYVVSNACGVDTVIKPIIVSDCWPTLVNNVSKPDAITLYPNPAQNSVTISSTGLINAVVISNVTGQEMLSENYNTKEVVVDLNKFAPGVYLVRINDTKVYKIVKQ